MRTFPRERKANQQSKPAQTAKANAALSGQPRQLHAILHLQRTIGNRAVQRLLETDAGVRDHLLPGSANATARQSEAPELPCTIQPKLTVGAANDPLEQEADRVADEVMRMPEPRMQRQPESEEEKEEVQTKPLAERITPLVQRQAHPEEKEEEEEPLQAKANHASTPLVTPALKAQINALRGGGQPLSDSARAFFEPRFGYDFSQVRVHTDSKASGSAGALNALAYTVGRDVVFGEGQYAPATVQGKRLIAHELAHVVQQGSAAQQKQTKQVPSHPAEQFVLSQSHLKRTPSNRSALSSPGLVQKKANGRSLPVPTWSQLPNYAQTDLAAKGYNANWFDLNGDEIHLTALNLYVKLKGLGLWSYVGKEDGSELGRLHFLTSDIRGLKDVLRERSDFTSPEELMKEWSSREMKASGALHFKHFEDWRDTKVQAHIDLHGLLLASKWWWLLPVVPLAQMLIHGITKQGFEDVYAVRDLLLGEGWDRAPLIGAGTAAIQREATVKTERNTLASHSTGVAVKSPVFLSSEYIALVGAQDSAEHEAEEVAEQVVREPNPTVLRPIEARDVQGLVQRWKITGDIATSDKKSDILGGLAEEAGAHFNDWKCIKPLSMRASAGKRPSNFNERYDLYVRVGDTFDISNLTATTGPALRIHLFDQADEWRDADLARLFYPGSKYSTDVEVDIMKSAGYGRNSGCRHGDFWSRARPHNVWGRENATFVVHA